MLSIVLPAYLEAENLGKILPEIHEALFGIEYEILVIDAVVPIDDTPEICKNNSAICIQRTGGTAYGDAIRTGIQKARGQYIVIMDADGSHSPRDIKKFLLEMDSGDYDLIIGSRYCRGGNTENNIILRFMSWILNVTYRLCFNIPVSDISDSFRLYKAEQLKAIQIECSNFDVVEEILIKLNTAFYPLRMLEVPITFHKRNAGESKRNLLKFVKSYIVTMWRLLKIKRMAERKYS